MFRQAETIAGLGLEISSRTSPSQSQQTDENRPSDSHSLPLYTSCHLPVFRNGPPFKTAEEIYETRGEGIRLPDVRSEQIKFNIAACSHKLPSPTLREGPQSNGWSEQFLQALEQKLLDRYGSRMSNADDLYVGLNDCTRTRSAAFETDPWLRQNLEINKAAGTNVVKRHRPRIGDLNRNEATKEAGFDKKCRHWLLTMDYFEEE